MDFAEGVRLEVLVGQNVAIEEFKHGGHSRKLEAQGLKDVPFLLEHGVPRETVMADSNHDGLHQERSDILVLGGDEHTSDADKVQLCQVVLFGRLGYISVHVLHREEEGLLAHLESCKHLEHPVDHSGATDLRYTVPRQMGEWRSRSNG